jgi:hypothetical protein
MVLPMSRPSRARVVVNEHRQAPIIWPKSLDGQPPFVASLDYIRKQNTLRDDAHLIELLNDAQALARIEEIDKPDWDPPELEDKITDLDMAREALRETLEHCEAYDWDAARVWREMYEREYAVSDKLREIAQKLDDKLDEGIKGIEEHNEEIERLSALARRLQLDVGL